MRIVAVFVMFITLLIGYALLIGHPLISIVIGILALVFCYVQAVRTSLVDGSRPIEDADV